MKTFHYRFPVRLSEEQRRFLETRMHTSTTPAEHYLVARVLLMSPRDAQRDIHLRRSGSGRCFIAFMVSALKGNFSNIESRVNHVIESMCEATLPHTVCWLAFRCASREISHDW